MNHNQTARYLSLLDVPATAPSRKALTTLIQAHLARVPFENLSKLLRQRRGRRPGIPALDEFLDGIDRDRTGGTCYACNAHLNTLLQALGYDAWLAGADMDEPDVHLVNIVMLAGEPYLVDVGYAAPFFTPMPLSPGVDRLDHGPDHYRLQAPDATGRNRIDYFQKGELVHGYAFLPAPRQLTDFAGVIADSFRPDSPFLNCLRMVKHRPRRSVSLRDFTVTITEGPSRRAVELDGRDALVNYVAREFGIPRALTGEACNELAARGREEFAAEG